MNITDITNKVVEETGIDAGICEKAVKVFQENSGDITDKLKMFAGDQGDIIKTICDKTGISEDQAKKIVSAIEKFVPGAVKDKLNFF